MEAMSFGVIPIATNVGGISEHIASETNGLLINAINEFEIIQEFVEKIDMICQNQELRKKLSKNAYDYAYINFGLENFNLSYQALFNS
jgi:glycosyltransferase involved in cell wall biosynthesis